MDINFKETLLRTIEFFTPESLKKQKITIDRIPSDVALLVIDVQKRYCDPKQERGTQQTDQIAKRIQSLVPEFRKAGIPAYVVYFKHDGVNKWGLGHIDFHHFKPEPGDMLIGKTRDSAFRGSNIAQVLREHQRKKLLVCGFNLSACVYKTVADARSYGFDVHILRDMVGNDNQNPGPSQIDRDIRALEKLGIRFNNSARVLQKVRNDRQAEQHDGQRRKPPRKRRPVHAKIPQIPA